MYIRNRYIICIQKDAGNRRTCTLSPPHTLTHITEHPNFTLKAGAHCSLLASPVAGVRRHQDFHSMKVVLPTPPHEESNQEYIDGDY